MFVAWPSFFVNTCVWPEVIWIPDKLYTRFTNKNMCWIYARLKRLFYCIFNFWIYDPRLKIVLLTLRLKPKWNLPIILRVVKIPIAGGACKILKSVRAFYWDLEKLAKRSLSRIFLFPYRSCRSSDSAGQQQGSVTRGYYITLKFISHNDLRYR